MAYYYTPFRNIAFNTTINSISAGEPKADNEEIIELAPKDYLESSQISRNLCYGCGFHFMTSFTANQGLYGKLCWDDDCVRPLRSYRMKFGDKFFLKYINLSRQTIARTHAPYTFKCGLMPDVNYDDYKVVSLYNEDVPEKYCNTTEVMYNNLQGGTVNIEIANYGRVRYQISFLYGDTEKAAGQIDRFFYFTFNVRDAGRIYYPEEGILTVKGAVNIVVLLLFLGGPIFACGRHYLG